MQRQSDQSSLHPAMPGRALAPDIARPGSDQIAALAYQLWLARGCPNGSPEEDWLSAEQQLKPDRAIQEDRATQELMAA
jgi:hypothetical protein